MTVATVATEVVMFWFIGVSLSFWRGGRSAVSSVGQGKGDENVLDSRFKHLKNKAFIEKTLVKMCGKRTAECSPGSLHGRQ